MAIKTDGTLWGWGYIPDGEIVRGSHNDYIAEPVRLATNSDWAAIFPDRGRVLLMKNDGSIWSWEYSTEAGPRWVFRNMHWNGSDWLETAGDPWRTLFLHKDGTLWASGRLPSKVFGTYIRSGDIRQPVRIGHDSNWRQISDSEWDLIGLKADGRLVESDRQLFSGILGQPSRYSDWIAVDVKWDGLAALAADGTVSFWSVYDRTGGGGGLLGPTHRPLWSLNVQ